MKEGSEKLVLPAANRPSAKTADLDKPLSAFGFEIDVVSGERVTGWLKVTEICCQEPYGVLHGGVSALIAESLGSIGAHVAEGLQRVAGIQLSVNHLSTANVGDLLFAEALPVHNGKTIKLWKVDVWKIDATTQEKTRLVSSSKVTLASRISASEELRNAATAPLKKYAKL